MPTSIVGTPGPDAIPDTTGDDSIQALGGADTITLTGGFDTVDGGTGGDTLVLDYAALEPNLDVSVGDGPDGGLSVTRDLPTGEFEVLARARYQSIEHFVVNGAGGDDVITGPNPTPRPFFADTISAGGGDDFVGLGFSRAVIDLGTGYNGATLDRSNATNDLSFDMPAGTYSGVEGLSGSLNYVETLKTGSGNDSVITGSLPASGQARQVIDEQIFYLGAGNDTLTSAGDTVSGDIVLAYGGDGSDTIVVDFGAATGSAYVVNGSASADRRDVQFEGFEHQVITTGAGADRVFGGSGDDTLSTGAAADTLNGGAGADVMIGGAGSDTYDVDNPFDQVIEQVGGGTGDVVYTSLSQYGTPPNVEALHYTGTGAFNGSTANGALYADGASSAYLLGGDGARLYGGAGDDTLQHRGPGSAQMYGGAGNDHFIIYFGDGHATISGGGGFDLLTYDASVAVDLHVDLTLVGNQAIGDGTVFQQIEQLHFTASGGNDYLRGGGAADVLKGLGGGDTLIGGGGADVLQGGAGHDTLEGDAGADTFRFDGPVSGSDDVVTDFQTGVDHVALSVAGFGISSPTDFDIVSAATGPTEAKATLVVDTAAPTIAWDADGSGAGAAVLLAHGDFTTARGDYVLF